MSINIPTKCESYVDTFIIDRKVQIQIISITLHEENKIVIRYDLTNKK